MSDLAYPNETERDAVKRLLAHPIMFPEEFKSWLPDFLATNIPKLPISQVFGFKVDKIQVATEITAAESTTSTSYVDLTTVGPELTQLANGYYIVLFGGRVSAYGGAPTLGDLGGVMSPSLSGSTPLDADCAAAVFNPMFRMTLVRLTSNDNNSIRIKYKKSGTQTSITFERRYMAAMRVISTD